MEPYFPRDFDETQLICWSCDTAIPGEYVCETYDFQKIPPPVVVTVVPDAIWVYNYSDKKLTTPYGQIAAVHRSSKYWVRAVRSMRNP